MSRVLVTGANGFVGREVCRRLLASGWSVRGAVRRTQALAAVPAGVEPCVVSAAGEGANWSSALVGVDAVVHLVGRTHVLRDHAADPLAAYRLVNVTGTCELLAASSAANVKRFIYMSSIKAVGEGSGELPYTEVTPCAPEDAYGVSKLEAEALVRNAACSGLEPVVLRPPLVYGPGVQGNFIRLLKAASKGIPLPLGAVRNARDMVYVANLASAVELSLEHAAATGQVFHVTDGVPLAISELIARLAGVLQSPARLIPVPVSLLRLGGKVLGREGEVNRLVGSLTVSSAKLRQLLGWVPPYSVDEGLCETAEWFRRAAGLQEDGLK